MIEIMNLRNIKPSEPYDFYIDRRSAVGNQKPITAKDDRNNVCDWYDTWFEKNKDNYPVKVYLRVLLNSYKKHGKLRLFCWCAPKRCHGQTIKKWIEEQFNE